MKFLLTSKFIQSAILPVEIAYTYATYVCELAEEEQNGCV